MHISGMIIDALIIIIFAVSILSGKSKGFVRIAATLAFSIIGIFVAKALAQPLAQWLTDNFVHERLLNYFSDVLTQNVENGTDAAIAALPEFISAAAANAGVSLKDIIGNSFSAVQIDPIAEKLTASAETVLHPVITGVSYILAFIAFKIVSSAAVALVSFIFKMPVLKTVNRLLGAGLGAVKGLIIVLVICSLLLLFQDILASSDFAEAIASSNLVHVFGRPLAGLM